MSYLKMRLPALYAKMCLKVSTFKFLILWEAKTKLGIKEGHSLCGAVQLSLILVLLLLVWSVRLSVELGLMVSVQIFADDDYLHQTTCILHLIIEEFIRTCWDVGWRDWADLLKEVVSSYRASITNVTANVWKKTLLIGFSEAQIFSLEPWISSAKVRDMPNFRSVGHFLEVSSVVLFCYTEVKAQKVACILSNLE